MQICYATVKLVVILGENIAEINKLKLNLFPRLPTESCALGSTQPLNMSTRKPPGSKAGRCVRLTTYHLLVPNVKKIRGLNLPDPHGPVQACSGTALLLLFLGIQ
jgi:hypothetical protein